MLAESASVLSRCVPPKECGVGTGLVVGYVQSGKTLSFTTVAALARDNGYRLIIVIAGSSVPLFTQSGDRLESDLGPFGHDTGWSHYDSDKIKSSYSAINNTLTEWETQPHKDCRAVLLTVMKNGRHLERLTSLLRNLGPILKSTPALIIDDEADQASLNTKVNASEESATYRRIGEIRALLPCHTYLQYTATPQAPLLINIIDTLSPDFAEVLTPGASYTGGKTFFENETKLVRDIPPQDIGSTQNPLSMPPDSLFDAMRIFFLGVAAGSIARYQDQAVRPRNRSMMVHPHRARDQHIQFVRWIHEAKENWADTLEGKLTTRDQVDEVEEFRVAYEELTKTVDDLLPFDTLMEQMPRYIRRTQVLEMNARKGKTEEPDWTNHYAYILVGGQALDRGFTVEGLTVTYMPRGLGIGNADTLQQRARWFGYKAGYLGYCRVYLSEAGKRAYKSYLDHEEYVRESLRRHKESGRPLQEWKRVFILERALKPTRKEVLDLPYSTITFGAGWLETRAPHNVEAAVKDNRVLVDRFLQGLTFVQDQGHPNRLPTHIHEVAHDVPVSKVLSELLTNFRFASSADSPPFTGLLLRLERLLGTHPEATCTVYHMRPSQKTSRGTEGGKIRQLFAGAYPVEGSSKVYPGDRGINAVHELTVQIHRVDVYDGTVDAGNLLQTDVPVLAVWVPKELTQDWVVQLPN